MPRPGEGVDEEYVVSQRDEGIVHNIGVFQVDSAVFYVIARVQKEFTIAVEFKSLRWLVNFVCSLEILSGTLSKLSLCCPDDFVEVLNLAEAALLLLDEASLVHRRRSKEGSLAGESAPHVHECSQLGILIHHHFLLYYKLYIY